MVNAEHFRTVQEEILRLNGEIERRDIVLEEYSKALYLLVSEVGKLPESSNGAIHGHDLNRAYSEAHDLLARCGVTPNAARERRAEAARSADVASPTPRAC